MEFMVYAELAEEVCKRLNRLSKKAEWCGVPFSYTVGEEVPKVIRILDTYPVTGGEYEVGRRTVAAVPITVECDGLIRANGWTVRARIEHGDKGNIVTAFDNREIPEEWYTVESNCDHCGVHRFRRETFFVENEDGRVQQVGSTCLKDYTGISPATAAMWAEICDLTLRNYGCLRSEWDSVHHTELYPVLDILACACDAISEFGYRRSADTNSTKDLVKRRLTASGLTVSRAGRQKAEMILSWLTTTSRDDESDLVNDCISLALAGWAKMSHVGRLAYMPVAFDRHCERVAMNERRQKQMATSQHIGTVGQRIELRVKSAALLSAWETAYGTTWLYRFVDENGNTLIWYASRPFSADDKGDAITTIRATVKDHREREGEKQTIITRCVQVA